MPLANSEIFWHFIFVLLLFSDVGTLQQTMVLTKASSCSPSLKKPWILKNFCPILKICLQLLVCFYDFTGKKLHEVCYSAVSWLIFMNTNWCFNLFYELLHNTACHDIPVQHKIKILFPVIPTFFINCSRKQNFFRLNQLIQLWNWKKAIAAGLVKISTVLNGITCGQSESEVEQGTFSHYVHSISRIQVMTSDVCLCVDFDIPAHHWVGFGHNLKTDYQTLIFFGTNVWHVVWCETSWNKMWQVWPFRLPMQLVAIQSRPVEQTQLRCVSRFTTLACGKNIVMLQ